MFSQLLLRWWLSSWWSCFMVGNVFWLVNQFQKRHRHRKYFLTFQLCQSWTVLWCSIHFFCKWLKMASHSSMMKWILCWIEMTLNSKILQEYRWNFTNTWIYIVLYATYHKNCLVITLCHAYNLRVIVLSQYPIFNHIARDWNDSRSLKIVSRRSIKMKKKRP